MEAEGKSAMPGVRGRSGAPKPNHVKLLEGNRHKGARAELLKAEPRGAGRPRRLAHLTAAQQAIYDDIQDSLPPELFSRADETMLERMAIATDLLRTAHKAFTNDGLMLQTNTERTFKDGSTARTENIP